MVQGGQLDVLKWTRSQAFPGMMDEVFEIEKTKDTEVWLHMDSDRPASTATTLKIEMLISDFSMSSQ